MGGVPAFAVNWLPFGPDGGSARRIVPDPEDHTHLYLGTTNGWIYESHNTGANWRRLARVDKGDDMVLDSIVVDATNPRHLLVGGYTLDHPDGGLFISKDGGKTWVSQPEMRGQSIRALRASTTDAKELVAGTLKGVFRSDDGGEHWKQISPVDSTEIHEVQSVAIDPADPNVIYAGTWHLPWKTTDGGEHWENIKTGIIDDSDVFSILVDPADPKMVYASACSGIYKSENAGVLFHKIQGIPSSARRTRVLMQDPNDLNIVFAGTTEGLWRSNDAGKTWTRTTGPEIIVNDISVDKADSHRVLIATDRGGVLASEDGGDTFHSSNAGFSARQITTMKRDDTHPATILVGLVNDKEWGGVFRSPDGGLSWTQRSEGLQGRDVFALGQAPDGTFIAGTSHGIFRLDPASEVWNKVEDAPGSIAAGDGPHAAAIRPAATRTSNRKLTPAQRRAALLAERRKAAASTAAHQTSSSDHSADREVAANRVAPPSGEAPPASDAAAPLPTAAGPEPGRGKGFDGEVYGLATAGRTVLATTSIGLMSSPDNGVTWTLSAPAHSEGWRYLAAAKNDVVAASLHSLAFSADEGQSWSPVPLPEKLTQISAIAVEPSGTIWVGGREGVFVSSDAGSTWTTPKNLFVNSVNSLYYDEPTQRMVVTTEGYSDIVFVVQTPEMKVSYVNTGWSLRFARPIGDHFIAATMYDGVVIQPRMIASPMARGTAEGEVVDPPVPPMNTKPTSE
jgi:photosystem II stability/assembly factor-like uncharacterized protein